MNWCCPQFKNYFANNTFRGLAIFGHKAKTPKEFPKFVLSFCVVDQEDGAKFRQFVKGKFQVKVSEQVNFSFCPWCGVSVVDHYKDDLNVMCD